MFELILPLLLKWQKVVKTFAQTAKASFQARF